MAVTGRGPECRRMVGLIIYLSGSLPSGSFSLQIFCQDFGTRSPAVSACTFRLGVIMVLCVTRPEVLHWPLLPP